MPYLIVEEKLLVYMQKRMPKLANIRKKTDFIRFLMLRCGIDLLKIIDHKEQSPGNKSVNNELSEIVGMKHIHPVVGTPVNEGPELFLLNIGGFSCRYPKKNIEHCPEYKKIDKNFFDFI